MTTHPTAAELLEAVIDWLGTQAKSGHGGGRDSYMALVARNALSIVQRELAQGPAADARATARLQALLGGTGDLPKLEAQLCARLRAGTMAPDEPALLAHLRAQVGDRLAIDQPKYRVGK